MCRDTVLLNTREWPVPGADDKNTMEKQLVRVLGLYCNETRFSALIVSVKEQ